MITNHTARKYIETHRWQGFDSLARNIASLTGEQVSKDDVKQYWNYARLGFKYVPRTEIRVRTELATRYRRLWLARVLFGAYVDTTEYVLEDDVLIFLDHITARAIPAGLKTNFGSIPSVLRWLVDKDDPHFLVAFLNHDLDYLVRWTSRSIADARLAFYAKELGAPLWKRALVYTGVRLGGWLPWYYESENERRERERTIQAFTQATARYREDKGSVNTLSVISKKYV